MTKRKFTIFLLFHSCIFLAPLYSTTSLSNFFWLLSWLRLYCGLRTSSVLFLIFNFSKELVLSLDNFFFFILYKILHVCKNPLLSINKNNSFIDISKELILEVCDRPGLTTCLLFCIKFSRFSKENSNILSDEKIHNWIWMSIYIQVTPL